GVESLADALLVGFDTDHWILVDAAFDGSAPTGKLPCTFPIDQAALAADEEGRCASPNVVPSFAKEQHIDGSPSVYVDHDQNRYGLGNGRPWRAVAAGQQ